MNPMHGRKARKITVIFGFHEFIQSLPKRFPRISTILQMPKYRILYFIYSKGRLKDELGLNGKLGRLFGYKSDGHLWQDIESLFDEGFLEKRDGFIIPTAKLKEEFSIFKGARSISVGCITIGGILLGYAAGVTIGYLRFTIVAVDVASSSLLALGILFAITYSKFVPKLPSKQEIRDSGLQSR